MNDSSDIFTSSGAAHADFILAADDSWIQRGYLNDVPHIVIADQERFRSAEEAAAILDSMFANGIQVFFIDAETYSQMRSADDYGMAIVKGLTSENQKQGRNFVAF